MSYSPNFRGKNSNASSRQTITGYQNSSGGTLAAGSPASVNASGHLVTVDVSSESNVEAIVGLVSADIPNSALGLVVDSGRLENVSNLSFSVGDSLYVSKAGFLTKTKPDVGVAGFLAGDFVIFVGVVVANEFDALKKDIKLMISVVGQL